MKRLAILGSTGSIGKNALSVAQAHPGEFTVTGLAANTSVDLMEQQIRQFRPRLAALHDRDVASQLRERLKDLKSVEILSGKEGVLAIATMEEVDLIIEAIGGSAGLLPTLEAIKSGQRFGVRQQRSAGYVRFVGYEGGRRVRCAPATCG